MSFKTPFFGESAPAAPSVPPLEARSTVSVPRPERRGSFKEYLALLALGAVNACAARGDQLRSTVDRSLTSVSAERRPEDRARMIDMAIEVARNTERMLRVEPQTVELLAQEMEQHDNPDLARDLRRMQQARAIGMRMTVPGAHVPDWSSPETRGDQSRPVVCVEDAQEAFMNVLDTRADGESRRSTSVDLALGLTDLYHVRRIEYGQARAVLGSGMFDWESDVYSELATTIPNAPVDLTRTFGAMDIGLFAYYVDHLNAAHYPTAGLTGAQARQGRIPLAAAVSLFASIAATGQLSRWDQMTWAGASTESAQNGSQQLNTDLSLRLAGALALFHHDIEFANGSSENHRRVFAPGETAPVVEQRPYAAWHVPVRTASAPEAIFGVPVPVPLDSESGHHRHGYHGHSGHSNHGGSHARRHGSNRLGY